MIFSSKNSKIIKPDLPTRDRRQIVFVDRFGLVTGRAGRDLREVRALVLADELARDDMVAVELIPGLPQ